MAEVKILERSEALTMDPTRAGKTDLWITYQVDGGRGDMVIVPKETATEASIQTAIRNKEADRAKLVGKTFTL